MRKKIVEINGEEYNIIVLHWFSEEEYFEASVKEFPHLTEYGDTETEVLELIVDAIETTLELMKDEDEEDC